MLRRSRHQCGAGILLTVSETEILPNPVLPSVSPSVPAFSEAAETRKCEFSTGREGSCSRRLCLTGAQGHRTAPPPVSQRRPRRAVRGQGHRTAPPPLSQRHPRSAVRDARWSVGCWTVVSVVSFLPQAGQIFAVAQSLAESVWSSRHLVSVRAFRGQSDAELTN